MASSPNAGANPITEAPRKHVMPANGSEAPVEVPIERPKKPATQLDRLKERRRKLAEDRPPLDLAIPGYGDELVARYRVLDFDEMQKLRERGGKMAQAQDREAELKVTMDTIAAACVGIFCRQEDGTLKPLNEIAPEFGDEPVRYDSRLAEAVGVDSEGKVRVLILQMFPTELSIIGHLGQIDAWMSGLNEADDSDF
jgi:hypothetical protein